MIRIKTVPSSLDQLIRRPVFGLRAHGDSLNGWAFRMHSRATFERREDAEAYIPDFTAACCDTNYFECANPETLKIEIIERDLYSPNVDVSKEIEEVPFPEQRKKMKTKKISSRISQRRIQKAWRLIANSFAKYHKTGKYDMSSGWGLCTAISALERGGRISYEECKRMREELRKIRRIYRTFWFTIDRYGAEPRAIIAQKLAAGKKVSASYVKKLQKTNFRNHEN